MKWEYVISAFLIGMAICQSNWYVAHGLLIVGLFLIALRVMMDPWPEEESDVDSK